MKKSNCESSNKFSKRKMIIPLLILVLFVIVGTSYALWQLTFRQEGTNTVTSGCFKVEFADKDPISLIDAYPISSTDGKKLTPYEFTLTNICEKEVDYYVNIETLSTENPLAENYIRASLTTSDVEVFSDTLKDDYINKKKVIEDSTKAFMLSSGTLSEKESKTFYLRLYLDEDTPLNNDTMNRTYQGKVTVTTNYVPDLIVRNMMIPLDITTNSYNIPTKNNTYTQNDKYQLSKVSFENKITNYENVVEIVDFSNDNDKSVQGYYVKDVDLDTYTLHIQANGKIQTNPNAIAFFSIAEDSTTIFEGIENIDTSFAEDMSYMFYKYNGETLDLSGFNTKNVTNMMMMFSTCTNLINLDLHSFDTGNVIDMSNMFVNCKNLSNLKLGKFDTSKVTNMNKMFNGCSSLTSLDVNHFNTSKVTNMSGIFANCSGLTSLDVSQLDTSKVTNMDSMFQSCDKLTELNLDNFNTSLVTNMNAMFYGCSSLINLDLSNFDTSQVVSMSRLFQFCSNLTNIKIIKFDTSKVTDMSYMFRNCKSLTNLDLSSFDTSNVRYMEDMFRECSSLTNITYGNNFIHITYAKVPSMFSNCPANKPTDSSWIGVEF